jgi:hypothetical protein
MYNKDYQDYFQVLRTREARPSFEQIAQLVASAETRDRSLIPFYARLVGPFVLGSIMAAGAWALFTPMGGPNASRIVPLHAAISATVSAPSHSSVPTSTTEFVSGSNMKLVSKNAIERGKNVRNSSSIVHKKFIEPIAAAQTEVPSNRDVPRTNGGDAGALLSMCDVRQQAASIHPIRYDDQPVPIIIPSSDEEITEDLFLTLGGAISQQLSTNTQFHQTSFNDAFLGIGYAFTPYSSLRLLVGEEVFSEPSSLTTGTIVFQDTIIGSSHDVIGMEKSSNSPILTRIIWLGGSYRYTLGDESALLRPFTEIMAGGSTDGFLTHQSIGAELTASNSINFDLLFETSELLPLNSSWLTKAGVSAAMQFRW